MSVDLTWMMGLAIRVFGTKSTIDKVRIRILRLDRYLNML